MRLVNMPRFSKSALLMLSIVIPLFLISKQAVADPLGNVTSYNPAATGFQSRNVVTGSDGNIWSVVKLSKKIAKTTTSGVTTLYTIPTGYGNPDNIANGPDNSLWFTVTKGSSSGTYKYAIGKITTTGTFQFYALPDTEYGPSKAYVPESLAVANGKIWVSRHYSKYIHVLAPNGDDATISSYKIKKPSHISNQDFDDSILKRYIPHQLIYSPANKTMYIFTREREPGNSSVGHYVEKYSLITGNSDIVALGYSNVDFHVVVSRATDSEGRVWFVGYSGSTSNKIGYFDPRDSSTQLFTTSKANDEVPSLTLGPDGNIWASIKDNNSSLSGRLVQINTSNFNLTEYPLPANSQYPYGLSAGADNNLWVTYYGSQRISKFGVGSVTNTDADNDGLTSEKELIQGTSDFSKDSDNDGLSDYTESQWNTTRDDVFCHPTTNYCEYPDPLQQDIYIETDWMQRPGGGGFSTKPSTTQVDLVKTAFANKGIKAHFDTGQLGGGDELPYEDSIYYLPESGEKDLYDYRDGEEGESQNFDTNRKDIYHYMISADEIAYNASGVSNTAADESIVAYGYVKDHPEAYEGTFDTAIAGTIIHELGHGLCLSDTAASYYGQNTACVFDGVDNGAAGVSLPYPFYVSSMNYSYQFELVDYSDGSNISTHPTGDHNDWAGIGIADYTKVDILDILSNESQSRRSIAPNKDKSEKLRIALNAEQATKIKQARKKAGIKIQQKTNGKFEVTQTQKGITKRLN